ncbi:MAG: hypothetical protein CO113_10280 [Elusimicrobia bacterium CG_4_9_14_3_um_filter_62_55]|nr:MAG: hypothetical protein COR54_12740 [Elusimicrobia bacterium CG22_combo_CG10-13_8_21_14_all_63_91]PJA18442.1 MAG: hypothetical protein COX66_01180 [Elusimicrobia bacterium CG_4_10_14_0_2_um_filter_63_34]PJB25120.1 MAG: hypothetical protein CO113_10280 [Elusimicrobia bacterium CG_4_9_14_3_um_filter_62_55]
MPDFAIWPDCNIGCVFCSNPVEGFRGTREKYTLEVITRKIEEYKQGHRRFLKFDQVSDYFNLTGGEPTLNPDFLKILGLIRKEFPSRLIRLLTNGRMFTYEKFCRSAFAIGGDHFETAIPVFGYDAKTHESISRAPGSFANTMDGLRHALDARSGNQKVEVRVILTRIQVKHLDGLIAMLVERFPEIDRLCFLFVEIEGFAEKYRERLTMPMSECAEHVDRCYDDLKKLKEVRLYHFPLCTLPTRLWPFVHNTLSDIKIEENHPECGRCRYREACVGVHRSYKKYMGAPDIRAIVEERPVRLSGDRYRPVDAAEEAVS